jgi:hypothetical protein
MRTGVSPSHAVTSMLEVGRPPVISSAPCSVGAARARLASAAATEIRDVRETVSLLERDDRNISKVLLTTTSTFTRDVEREWSHLSPDRLEPVNGAKVEEWLRLLAATNPVRAASSRCTSGWITGAASASSSSGCSQRTTRCRCGRSRTSGPRRSITIRCPRPAAWDQGPRRGARFRMQRTRR